MANAPSGKEAFIVQILDSQNSTWQGSVTWANSGKTLPFRSLLELIKLIDGVLAGEASGEPVQSLK